VEISPAQPVLRFGPYEADLRAGVLRKDGTRIRVQEKPLQVLAALAERQGELVTRAELQKRLWPNETFVDFEDGLNTAVKKLRVALSDDAEEPRYIETIPRRGYRFIAPVEVIARNPGTAKLDSGTPHPQHLNPGLASATSPRRRYWQLALLSAAGVLVIGLMGAYWLRRSNEHARAASAPIRSLAVLPFQNLSGDPGQEYFAEGITDGLATELGQIPSLRVTSPNSMMLFRGESKPILDIRQKLGVDAVLEGSVVRDGAMVRLDARLIGTADGRTIWARRFESNATGVIGTEDRLVRSVAERVQMVLYPDQRTELGKGRPTSNQAYEAYLHGLVSMHHRTAGSLRRSVEYFSEAIRLDPGFARAYAELAHSYCLLADYGILPDRLEEPKAEMAARRALQLDDSLGPAHSALAFVLWHYDWKWKAAEPEFKRAITLDPDDANAHHWYALFLASKDDFTGAEREIQQARKLDPLSSALRTNIGWIEYYQGNLSNAVADYQDVLQADPSLLPAHEKLWIAYALQGNRPAALQQLDFVLQAFRQMEQGGQIRDMKQGAQSFRKTADEYVDSPYVNDYERARVLSIIGERTKALGSLREAEHERAGWMVYIGVEPAFKPLRSSPEFQRLLEDVGVRPAKPRLAEPSRLPGE